MTDLKRATVYYMSIMSLLEAQMSLCYNPLIRKTSENYIWFSVILLLYHEVTLLTHSPSILAVTWGWDCDGDHDLNVLIVW